MISALRNPRINQRSKPRPQLLDAKSTRFGLLDHANTIHARDEFHPVSQQDKNTDGCEPWKDRPGPLPGSGFSHVIKGFKQGLNEGVKDEDEKKTAEDAPDATSADGTEKTPEGEAGNGGEADKS